MGLQRAAEGQGHGVTSGSHVSWTGERKKSRLVCADGRAVVAHLPCPSGCYDCEESDLRVTDLM